MGPGFAQFNLTRAFQLLSLVFTVLTTEPVNFRTLRLQKFFVICSRIVAALFTKLSATEFSSYPIPIVENFGYLLKYNSGENKFVTLRELFIELTTF